MLNSLKEILNMLENINRSVDNKTDLLIKYLKDPIFGKTLARTLEYMTDPNKIFRPIRIGFCIYFNDPIAIENQNVGGIFQMLDYLLEKETDPSAEEISFLEKISSADPETVEIVTRIITKSPACGLTNEEILRIIKETTSNGA